MKRAKLIELIYSTFIALIGFGLIIYFKSNGLDINSLFTFLPIVFIGIPLFIAIVLIIIKHSKVKKEQARIQEIKNSNMMYEIQLDAVYGRNNKFVAVTSCNIEGIYYQFISTYSGNGIMFERAIKAKDIKTVKVWLDLTNPKIFELDINDLFNKVGSSYQIVYEGRMVYTDKVEADSMIKFLTDRRY